MAKIKVNIGDVFVVPLRSEGYGIGLIARKHRNILLGYFWKEFFSKIPNDLELSSLNKDDTFWIKQFGIRGLEKGEWKILGNKPNFSPKEWEVPKFIRETKPFGKYLVTYDDKLKFVNQEKVPDNFRGLHPKDGLAGYGFVELKLTDFLTEQQ